MTPLLRGITAQTIARVAGEEQILVFAERINCLRQLARTLRERHGIETHVADGSVDEITFGRLKRAFQAGEFPVFCLGPVAREGHNLQNSSVIVHLDLPALPTRRSTAHAQPQPRHDAAALRRGRLQPERGRRAGSSTATPVIPWRRCRAPTPSAQLEPAGARPSPASPASPNSPTTAAAQQAVPGPPLRRTDPYADHERRSAPIAHTLTAEDIAREALDA